MHRPLHLLALFSLVAVIVTMVVAILKYVSFQFNTLDLAIYSQVFWNTAHGHLFASSIQNVNYLGDHVELWILPLSIIFRIFPHPLTLVAMQAIALFSSSLLLYRLAQNYLPKKISFYVAIAYLLNPVIWNMAWTDFHMLIFAIPLIFWVLDALAKDRFGQFAFAASALLLVREDAAFALIGIGIYALVRRRMPRYWLFPISSAVLWFVCTMAISQWANPEGYKFFIYYGWLGNSFGEIATTIFTKPWNVIIGLLDFNNILLIVACTLLFFGLPIFAGSALLMLIPLGGQILLGRFNPQLLLETHYLALVIPLLFFTSIIGMRTISRSYKKFISLVTQYRNLIFIIACLVLSYSFLFLGPLVGTFRMLLNIDWQEARSVRSMLHAIPKDASVVSSYAALPNVAMRSHVYDLHYVALGSKQFSSQPYVTEVLPTHVLVDLHDLTVYELQYAKESYAKEKYIGLSGRLRTFLSNYKIMARSDNTLLLKLADGEPSALPTLAGEITSDPEAAVNTGLRTGPISITAFTLQQNPDQHPILHIEWKIEKQITAEESGYAFHIASSDNTFFEVPIGWNLWPLHAGQIEKQYFMNVLIPNEFKNAKTFTLSLSKREGYAGLNGLGGASVYITKRGVFSGSLTATTLHSP